MAMVDAIALFNMFFSDDDSSESDEDEFWVDSDEEMMDDEDENEDNYDGRRLRYRYPLHRENYVIDENYSPFQEFRYAGNTGSGWPFLMKCTHTEGTPLWKHFYDQFGMRQEDFDAFVEQARVATKRNDRGEVVRRFVDETGGGRRPKPIRLADKIGACLYYVRQNSSWEACSHLLNMSPDIMRVFFYEFIAWISEDKYDEEVYPPRNAEERDRIESCYASVGLPGCIGSTDGVHIPSKAIPKEHRQAAMKAGGKTSYVVNVIVDMNYVIQSASKPYYGATNDLVALESDAHFNAFKNNPLFRETEYTLKDIQGNDVIERGNYLIADGGYSQDKRLMNPVKAGRLAQTPHGLLSRQLESVRKDAECTFALNKQAFAIFNGPLRFGKPRHVNNLFRTLFYLHNKRARSLLHHEVGQEDEHWKHSRRRLHYEATQLDIEFAQRARNGVQDGEPGRSVYIADETLVNNRKKNWSDRRTRLAQHLTHKDALGELKWRKTYAELNLPRR